MKINKYCQVCSLNNAQHYETKVINNNPSSNKWYYIILEFPINATQFFNFYLKQLTSYNIVFTYAVACKDNGMPSLTEVNKCKNILQEYFNQYQPYKILAMGPYALASLKRLFKLQIDEKNQDFDEIYEANNITIYATYNPLMYFKSKNKDFLIHIHNKLEETFNIRLQQFQYYDKHKINSATEKLQNLQVNTVDLEIDLNNFDIQLGYSDKTKTCFTLYKPDVGYKYLLLDNIALLYKAKNVEKINFPQFFKAKKLSAIYASDDPLPQIVDVIGSPLNIKGLPFSTELIYSIVNKFAVNKAFYEPKYVVVDIELVSPTMPDPNNAINPIVCLTIYQDGEYYKYYTNTNKILPNEYIKFETEKEMLEHVWANHLAKASIFVGWNAYFDFVTLWNRAYKLGIDVAYDIYNFTEDINMKLYYNHDITKSHTCKLPFFTIFDLMEIYETYISNKDPSTSLDYIAKKELGYAKVKLEDSINSLWQNNPEQIMYYNYIDTKLTTEILHKYNFIQFFDEIRRIINMPLNYNNYTPIKYGMYIMFNEMIKNNIISSYSAINNSNLNIKYTGAYVQQPVPVLITSNK